MPTNSLLDQLCTVLSCKHEELFAKLHDGKTREQAIAFLKLVPIKTTHLRFNKSIKFAGLTYTGARHLMAFRGFMMNSTVAQYYYIKHRIILGWADFPCVIELPSESADHISYYPLELLTAVSEQEDVSKMFPEEFSQKIAQK